MASIAKRPDGRWRARYRDGAGKEHARHFTRKVDAQRWLDEVTTAVLTGRYVDPREGRTTFATYYAGWSARQVWAPNTVKAMDLAARSASFSDVQLAQLRRSHLEAWVKAMHTAGLAPGTIRTRFSNVRAVLRAAVRDRMLAEDPSLGVVLPRARRAEAAMSLPTTEQVAAVLDAADPHFRAFVAVGAFAGLRLGEVAGLQVQDVDFLGRRILVARQVQRMTRGELDVRAPKFGSERSVYVADELLEDVAQHIAEHRPGEDRTRWLFTRPGGQEPMHQNSVGYLWRKACRLAGLEGLTLHDLRHWYASGLIASGCDVVTVQRALGHRSANVTLRVYSHLWPTAEDRTRTAVAALHTAARAASARAAADSPRTTASPQAADLR
ncbi:tyrosine-type recombinase/integrase [Kineococcus terrestris]|uniref:tyrosine-type recombinase/integrase n=1 Tax=Kineococcus terrestris TaxID=2044856 RepID=UPI0034DB7A59